MVAFVRAAKDQTRGPQSLILASRGDLWRLNKYNFRASMKEGEGLLQPCVYSKCPYTAVGAIVKERGEIFLEIEELCR